MLDVYDGRGASAHQINGLAEWVRKQIDQVNSGLFDVIRFIEIDLPKLFPGLYVIIEADEAMPNRRAFISADPLGLVVSESIYIGAQNGSLFSAEIILHEVGHLFLHRSYERLGLNNGPRREYRQQIRRTGAANSAEWQADTFAICLLYPYRQLFGVRTSAEIRSLYPISEAQAARVIRHLTKLRFRESERRIETELRWLHSVLGSLPSPAEKVAKHTEQLSFFYSGTSHRDMVPASC